MKVENGQVQNRYEDKLVFRNGQFGDLEGLGQKGWSVLNLLVIERAEKTKNRKIKILAQGDNQVICTFYDKVIYKHIADIQQNNKSIMKEIRILTVAIGLMINEDETLQSADMLIYGKVIMYRGNIICLEEKIYSRITCTTNDQLPNTVSTVATNCLTVVHYSKSPLNVIVSWLGNFAISLLTLHNPALRCTPSKIVKDPKMMEDRLIQIEVSYI